jgi:hypothetical protein
MQDSVRLKARRKALREQILNMLGWACARCGFTDDRALCIDHINGGGEPERKKARSSEAYYKAILASGGAGYQILCCNCNAIKRIERGEHRRARGLPLP